MAHDAFLPFLAADAPAVIAEAGMTMEGSAGRARDLVDAAADAGCWGFKVQLLKPERIAAAGAARYWSHGAAISQREVFARARPLPYEAWAEIAGYCGLRGVEFLATPFDLQAVDVLSEIGVRFVKIASGDLTYRALIERVAAHELPMILSTGAATHTEIRRTLSWLPNGYPVVLLACTLAYPTDLDHAMLGRIEGIRRSGLIPQDWPVGYSDHTRSFVETPLAAAALGARLLEKHFTLGGDPDVVPDHDLALDPARMAEYVRMARLGWQMRGGTVLAPIAAEIPAWAGARRGVYAARTIRAGQTISPDDLDYLRPADGADYEPWEDWQVIGATARVEIPEGAPLRRPEVEPPF
jgi:sialic acid synthase SpsE